MSERELREKMKLLSFKKLGWTRELIYNIILLIKNYYICNHINILYN